MWLSTYYPAAPKAAAALADGANAQPVFMGHGTQDPVVPFRAGEQSQSLLREFGFTVDWLAYPMPHSVCLEEIRDLGDWLAPRLAGEGPEAAPAGIRAASGGAPSTHSPGIRSEEHTSELQS